MVFYESSYNLVVERLSLRKHIYNGTQRRSSTSVNPVKQAKMAASGANIALYGGTVIYELGRTRIDKIFERFGIKSRMMAQGIKKFDRAVVGEIETYPMFSR